MIKAGSPEDMDRMVARLDADKTRPMDDSSPMRDFPRYAQLRITDVDGRRYTAIATNQDKGQLWLVRRSSAR